MYAAIWQNTLAALALVPALFVSCTLLQPELGASAVPGHPAEDAVAAVRVGEAHGPSALDVIAARFRSRRSGLSDVEIRQVASTVIDASERNGLDWELILAVIHTESGYYNFARSHVNALGLMQVLPSTGAEVAEQLGIEWNGEATLFDPTRNIEIGSYYLGKLYERYRDRDRALASYNWGPTAIARRLSRGKPLPVRYVRKVKRALLLAAAP